MATVLLALSLMFHTAPGVILAEDMLPALSVAADRPLKHFPPGSLIYVKSALGPMFLEALRSRHPSLTLRPYSERMEQTCADRDPPLSGCERDDYLKLEVLSSPTRGSLLVAMGTSKAFGQMLLINLLGHWCVLMERTYSV
ncbi:MAG TPA: hypothetical protein VGH75_08250 [Steroidobacteraceae bacterium]